MCVVRCASTSVQDLTSKPLSAVDARRAAASCSELRGGRNECKGSDEHWVVAAGLESPDLHTDASLRLRRAQCGYDVSSRVVLRAIVGGDDSGLLTA